MPTQLFRAPCRFPRCRGPVGRMPLKIRFLALMSVFPAKGVPDAIRFRRLAIGRSQEGRRLDPVIPDPGRVAIKKKGLTWGPN